MAQPGAVVLQLVLQRLCFFLPESISLEELRPVGHPRSLRKNVTVTVTLSLQISLSADKGGKSIKKKSIALK